MRVFLCGVDSGLGFAIAQRLLAEGHSVSAVTRFDVRSWKSSGVKAILGEIDDPAAQYHNPRSAPAALVKKSRFCAIAGSDRRRSGRASVVEIQELAGIIDGRVTGGRRAAEIE